MLETRFPRIPGDMGNAMTWPFPVQYRVVKGASPDRVVLQDPTSLLPELIAAARDLVASGCDGLTTNCGFLALLQQELSAAVPVPIATSSLLQIPMLQRMLPPGKKVGVLTISKDTLTTAHFQAAGVTNSNEVPIGGPSPNGAFASGILGDEDALDFARCRAEMSKAAVDLVESDGDIGAIVLECTNMVPYAPDIRKQTGLPVYSIYTLVSQFHAGLAPRVFDGGVSDPRWQSFEST